MVLTEVATVSRVLVGKCPGLMDEKGKQRKMKGGYDIKGMQISESHVTVLRSRHTHIATTSGQGWVKEDGIIAYF